ncbi:MAG TPA: hypothetical protein VHC69_14285 [Polyangiaceae bacterium]|nr:hypothetical protein [Polyangiaceae bacterium]
MTESHFDEACPKLAESQRLAPASGTLLNLAVCHERQGKTASAWLEYHDVVALSLREKNTERGEIATQRIRALEAQLSRLKVKTTPNAPLGMWITIDGEAVGRQVLRSGLPVDPGVHDVKYGAPGYDDHAMTFVAPPAGKEAMLVLPELRPHATSDLRRREADVRRGWAISGAAFGVAGAAFSAVAFFGVSASNAWRERNRHCDATGCDAVAVSEGRHAQQLAAAADVALGLGLAGAAVGTYFLVRTLNARVDLGTNGKVELLVGGSL